MGHPPQIYFFLLSAPSPPLLCFSVPTPHTQVLTFSFVQIRANPDLLQLAQSKGFTTVDQYLPGLNYFQSTVSLQESVGSVGHDCLA
jgi:hypothetical protein